MEVLVLLITVIVNVKLVIINMNVMNAIITKLTIVVNIFLTVTNVYH